MPLTVTIDISASIQRVQDAFNRGFINEACGLSEDLYERLPDHPGVQMVMSHRCAARGERQRAVDLAKAAITKMPMPDWITTLSGWLLGVGATKEAVEAARRGLKPQFAESSRGRVALAKALWEDGDAQSARSFAASAIAADPKNPEAHLLLGEIMLCQQEWRGGWREYEWRNDMPIAAPLPEPLRSSWHWNGASPPKNAGALVVLGDQGYGDCIQFSRYLPELMERWSEVHLAVSNDMVAIMKRSFPKLKSCFGDYSRFPAHDTYCSVTSLPWVLGHEEEPPWNGPYLSPDPLRTGLWRGKLPLRGAVGMVWKGRPTHPNDGRRSATLDAFGALRDAGQHLVSLQKPTTAEEDAKLEEWGIPNLGRELASFEDTASIVGLLQGMVCVDTGVGHLAGALGCPTWIVTPTHSDWRWHTEEQSIWYPSVKAIRQTKPGDWSGALARVVDELRAPLAEAAD